MFTNNFALLSQRVKEHVEADSIIQGVYWTPVTMRGCFIGCLARNGNSREATFYNEKTYGLPIPLQRIAESIFEELPPIEAKKFFASLPEAIGQDGKDLTNIHWKFLAVELRSLPQQSVEIQTIIDQVIDGLELLSQSMQWTEAAEIAKAAYGAVAGPDDVGCVGWVLFWATNAATWAADDVRAATAWCSDARGAATWAADTWLRRRDSLLRLIKKAPVKPI